MTAAAEEWIRQIEEWEEIGLPWATDAFSAVLELHIRLRDNRHEAWAEFTALDPADEATCREFARRWAP